jgi:hypothetical protein
MAPEARDPLTGRWSGLPPAPTPAPSPAPASASTPAAGLRVTATSAPGPLATAPLAAVSGQDDGPPAAVHACWYASADPAGTHAAFISDRGGLPQLWCGALDSPRARLLDPGPDPVTEVSWSPDGRWIAYVTAPGGGEHTRVLAVRPDGTGRHALGGAEPGTSADLGCWARDGSALAVTVAEAVPPGERGAQEEDAPGDLAPGQGSGLPSGAASDVLSAYWIDPDGGRAPRLLASERGAAALRVCDSTADGRLVLLRRGPRGRREAVVVRPGETEACWRTPVADGDPWIGRFSPGGDTLWLRTDAGREFAALAVARLAADGSCLRYGVAAERAGADLELLGVSDDGRQAVLAWNVSGRTVLETAALDEPGGGGRGGAGTVRTGTGWRRMGRPGTVRAGTGRPGLGAARPSRRCRCRTRWSPGWLPYAPAERCWICRARGAGPASGCCPRHAHRCAPRGRRPTTPSPRRRAGRSPPGWNGRGPATA